MTTDDLETPKQVEVVGRQLQAPELIASQSEALVHIDERERHA